MLKHLAIQHFAIVDQLELDMAAGMTVITGETGAGKSIMLDALGLCLGDRADSKTVQPGEKRAEISAEFSIEQIPAARQWLAERDLDQDDACILRRTVGADGRSRAFINGSPSTLADCAALGELLVDIHSQHAHQSLLRKSTQRQLLDAFAKAIDLAEQVAEAAHSWRRLSEEYQRLANQGDAERARRDLLSYQVEELDQLALVEGELETLEESQKALSNANFIIESAARVADACEQQGEQLRVMRADIEDPRHAEKAVANARELLTSIDIQLDEARRELTHYADTIELDPGRLREVESRLESIYDLARKHRVMPEQLGQHHADLKEELAALDSGDERLDAMAAEVSALKSQWQTSAKKLTSARRKAAKKLEASAMTALAQLSMERCRLEIRMESLEDAQPHPHGAERISFLISTNPGAAPDALAKVASGGELSRISLALQVAAAEVATAPTMVFDEVDVGIGGGTAEVVGELLRSLSASVQVICVTHLPQVAAKGHQHLQVSKAGDAKKVSTQMASLDPEARVQELARMLGGKTITDSTVSHAREMLENA
jgi:DNA repair protein RecN (Recombination protein N)